jgi:superfamily I DNA/RNA helicase
LLKNEKDIAKILKDRFKYVLVDEFQDVNSLQVKFIKLLLTEETQLFCVGDDWQSIYGFRGSDVSYIVEFEKHFNPSKVITLNINYRSTQNIVDAGNEVIKHNKFKIDKEIFAIKPTLQKIMLFSASEEEDGIEETLNFCVSQVVKLQKEGYTSDVIKRANHELLMEEERRLFYVAVTRAKEKLFLISRKGNESSFISEIPKNLLERIDKPIDLIKEKVFLCNKCRKQIDELHKFCPNCGEKIVYKPAIFSKEYLNFVPKE